MAWTAFSWFSVILYTAYLVWVLVHASYVFIVWAINNDGTVRSISALSARDPRTAILLRNLCFTVLGFLTLSLVYDVLFDVTHFDSWAYKVGIACAAVQVLSSIAGFLGIPVFPTEIDTNDEIESRQCDKCKDCCWSYTEDLVRLENKDDRYQHQVKMNYTLCGWDLSARQGCFSCIHEFAFAGLVVYWSTTLVPAAIALAQFGESHNEVEIVLASVAIGALVVGGVLWLSSFVGAMSCLYCCTTTSARCSFGWELALLLFTFVVPLLYWVVNTCIIYYVIYTS